jgi:hypothetical protein
MEESVAADTLSRMTRPGILSIKQPETIQKEIAARTTKTNSSICLNEECTFVDLCHHRLDCALKLRNFRYCVHVVDKFKHVTHGQQERLYLVVAVLLTLQSLQVETEIQYRCRMSHHTNLVNKRQHLPCEPGIRMDLQINITFGTE